MNDLVAALLLRESKLEEAVNFVCEEQDVSLEVAMEIGKCVQYDYVASCLVRLTVLNQSKTQRYSIQCL